MSTAAAAAAAAAALLAAVAAPFDLPAPPGPGEGYAALFGWLRAVNSQLSIPDAEFRWMFGGLSIPILLVLELVGIRKDWKLYPFLLPFWLVFGGVALGVVGGLAATAAHLVLFPAGRIWFTLRDRRRARDAAGLAPAPARPPAAGTPGTRNAREVLLAAVGALRAAAEQRGAAQPTAQPTARPAARLSGEAPGPTWGAILRELSAALTAAASARTAGRPPGASSPGGAPPPHAPARPPEPAAPPSGKPDFSAFRPDPARFRRRPPRG